MIKVCLVGAGGKMGLRLTRNLKGHPGYLLSCLENGEQGKEKLKQLGIPTSF
jgi:N-acetyl-gamma-glutamylphosphate reductase